MDSGLDQYEPLLLYIRDEVDREGLGITDLEKRIEKLEEGFRKIELKNRSKSGEVYDLMERVR